VPENNSSFFGADAVSGCDKFTFLNAKHVSSHYPGCVHPTGNTDNENNQQKDARFWSV
jgi:hypothetical protein